MSLRLRIYLVTLIPFVAFGVTLFVGIEQIARRYAETLESSQQASLGNAERRFQDLAGRLGAMTINLSRPREIQNGVETADNEVLYDWSASFIGVADDIQFADAEGVVLARAPEEYAFGDNIAGKKYFAEAMRRGSYAGLTEMDGVVRLVAARRIDKYDDMALGVVSVGRSLTPQLLDSLGQNENMILTFERNGGGVDDSSASDSGDRMAALRPDIPGFDLNGELRAVFLEDEGYRELLTFKRSMLATGLVVSGLTLAALLLLVHTQFKPYGVLVQSLLDYTQGDGDLESLRNRVESVRGKPSREITRLAEALIQMVETIARNFQRINNYNDQLQELASTDPLTLLRNRRFMDRTMDAEAKRSIRYGTPLALVLLDIDHFKRINDSHGHQVGDQVLCQMAALLRDNSRESDIIGRWGGEEMLIVSPGLDMEHAKAYAERLRGFIESASFFGGLRVTASFGVAEYEAGESLDSLLIRVDKLLYVAKNAGRNRVEG